MSVQLIPYMILLVLLVQTCYGQTDTSAASSTATASAIISIWPEGKMPGVGAKEPEAEKPSKDAFHRITNVSNPTLSLFLVGKPDQPAPAVIICPGGGYGYVVIDKEGTHVAAWLNAQGISALVLKYRNPGNRDGALQDLQRAVSLVRDKAAEWHIDNKRMGVMGFSAGGHLAARASTQFEQRTYAAIDAIDKQNCRPDFTMLIYPAYLGREGKVSPELNLKVNIPPTLIVHCEDDALCISGSKLYCAALTEAKIPHESKLYTTGGHGFGLHSTKAASVWPDNALTWLRKISVR
jgi:acetyl esterase/lipase